MTELKYFLSQLTLEHYGNYGFQSLHSQISVYKFWLPEILTTNSLPLTRSLTDNINSRLTHFYDMSYIQIYISYINIILMTK